MVYTDNCLAVEVTLDIVSPKGKDAVQLCFKFGTVSDGKRADLTEAIAQAQSGPQQITTPHPVIDSASKFVQSVDPAVQKAISFSDSLGAVMKKLEFIQSVGDHLSEVSPFANP